MNERTSALALYTRHSLGNTEVKRQPVYPPCSLLHSHFYLARRYHLGLDDSLGVEVLYPNLFAHAAVGQGLAGHAHGQGAAASGDDHLVALANHFGLFQMNLGDDLIGDHWSDKFLTNGFVDGGQETLADLADVALTQDHILRLDNPGALERTGSGDNFPIQAHLSGHEHRPGRRAVATNLHRDASQRPGRALQRGSQFLVAHRHAQARVELVDFNLVAAFGLTGCQIVFYGEFKKALRDADKEIRQGNRHISDGTCADREQADGQQCTEPMAAVSGQASRKCRLCVHAGSIASPVPFSDECASDTLALGRSQGMAGVMDSVNQRTQLVGQNRLELLLFRLDGQQLYGINVFKVREVLQCPKLTLMPKSSPVVCGVANIRGATIPILDLAMATGSGRLLDQSNPFVIITEYNTKTQGFLVRSVERIVNMNWEEIHPPPKGTGRDHYLTAVTRVDNQLVEIIDVEKILAEVAPTPEAISAGVVDAETQHKAISLRVLTVDDSSVARKQVTRCLQTVGVEVVALNDGRQALDYLRQLVDEGKKPEEEFLMMISDIEMPEMDGYTLTSEIRSDPRMQKLHIILHTSLSGVFNQAMVKKVGADDFLAKFRPDDLASRVVQRIKAAE